MENLDCHRRANTQKGYNAIQLELMKLVPEEFEISMLPAFFNHTDGDRIGTVIKDVSLEFLTKTPKKVMFMTGVKVFPYGSGINSVRVVIFKLSENESFEGAHGEGEGHGKSKKGSSKGSKKSKS
jgi:hypothetical protein